MRIPPAGLFLIAALAIGGCRGGATTSIKTLLDDPASYDGKTVAVAGTVGRSIGVLGYGAYELSDGTGTLPIVSKTGGAPREGAEVAVRGEFKSAFTLGTTTVAALIEKDRAAR